MLGTLRCLETEGSEGLARESGRPVAGRSQRSLRLKPLRRTDRNRSQNVHSSDEAPVMGRERRDVGRWRRDGQNDGTGNSAGNS
jgi:hypothetical protein